MLQTVVQFRAKSLSLMAAIHRDSFVVIVWWRMSAMEPSRSGLGILRVPARRRALSSPAERR